MNRETLDAMIAQAIEQAVETHLPHGAGQMTAVRLRTALQTVAQRTEAAARAYYLGNLITVDDLAAQWGVSRRYVQQIARDAHERWGKGMKIAGTYIFSADEVEGMKPTAPRGRPRKHAD